jgi:aminocarboxymuconate-semialdehyde decarboxylase
MKNVDLHSHVIPSAILDAARRDPARFGISLEEHDGKLLLSRPGHRSIEVLQAFYDVEAKVESMDRMKLDIAAISVAPPAFFYGLKPDAGLAAARLNNDGIAQMVAKYPARLRGMATLPMQDPDAAIVELERVVKEHKFKAVELGTSVEGEQLADPKFRKVLKTIEQLGCFVFAHPYNCVAKGGMEGYNLMILMGYLLDTTIMVSHLMLSGAMDDLPRLRILLAHGGGFMPYQIGRYEHGYHTHAYLRETCKTSPDELLRRFYFDALVHDPQAVQHLVNKVGADHVVIGTDHPYDSGPADPLGSIAEVPGLSAMQREQICGHTALRLLGEA